AGKADDALFEMAKARNTSTALAVYLEKGKRHAPEVESVLMPEAVYNEAVQIGKVALLVSFAERYPHSPHAAEARAEVHQRYEAELAEYVQRNVPAPPAYDFVEALLASAERRNDASLVVRVTMADQTPIAAADAAETTRSGNDYEPAAPHMTFIGDRVER